MGQSSSIADLRAADVEIDRLLRRGDLVLLSRQSDPLLDGRTHERLQQLYQGIPVIGGQVTRELEDGLTRSVFATLFADVTSDTVPQVGAEAARASVERLAGVRLPPLAAPQLVILPSIEASYALAWRVEAAGDDQVRHVFFVSAGDATLLHEYIAPRRQAHAHALADLAGARDSAALREMAGEFDRSEGQAGETDRQRAEFRQTMSRAFANLLPAGSSLALARAASRQSVIELFGADSAAARMVEQFWKERM